MSNGLIRKKVDDQGRIVLPVDWREKELSSSKEVFIIKGSGFLKIIPKKDFDLTELFDSVDLGTNIEDWDRFEEEIYKR